MNLRRSTALMAVLLFTLPALAQVKIVGPSAVTINVVGDSGSTTLLYDGTADVVVSPVGPLQFTKEITVTPGDGPAGTKAAMITVTPGAKLSAGASYSGTIIFKSTTTTAGTPSSTTTTYTDVPLTVTRSVPAFTAEAETADICLECGTENVISLRIRNTGGVTIPYVEVLPISLHDASRHHRWFVSDPVTDTTATGTTYTATTGSAAESMTQPHSYPVNLAPGGVTKIRVVFDPPWYAGDYAGTIEVQAAGATEPVKTSVTIRTRGPGGSVWAGTVFVVIVLIGALLAWKFEGYYGGGGGEARGKALLSLDESREALAGIRTYLEEWRKQDATLPALLPLTMEHIGENMEEATRLLQQGVRFDPEHLKERAAVLALAVDKRRVFRRKLDFAMTRVKTKKEASDLLDGISDEGTVEAYRTALENAIKSVPEVDSRKRLEKVQEAARDITAKVLKEATAFRRARWIVLALVSLATAYLMLFNGKCSFGSLPDYISTFFWSLGLTGAGNVILGEGKSKYKAEPIG